MCEEDSETGSAAECPPGYQFFLVTCVDINECHENTSTCPESHVCVNTEGSYTCQPSETFRAVMSRILKFKILRNSFNSILFQEYKYRMPIFWPNYSIGSNSLWQCWFRENNPCPAGFLETGGKCEDVNECMTGEHSCLVSQRCDNTLGSYVCTRYTTCGTGSSDQCCQE